MSLLLTVARASVAINIGLLSVLIYVWVGNYRRYRASYTLALLVFAAFLFVQNIVWGYLYVGHAEYIQWFTAADDDVQILSTVLCTSETVALTLLVYITWQ